MYAHAVRHPAFAGLLAGFVYTDLWSERVVGPLIHIQDVFHGVYEGGVVGWGNAEAFDEPRLQRVFFRRRQIVVLLTVSTILNSTIRFANSDSVQLARPSGGSLQAI